MLQSFGQVYATMLHLGTRTSSIFNTQHVATGWPDAHNMLCPTTTITTIFYYFSIVLNPLALQVAVLFEVGQDISVKEKKKIHT